MTMKKEDFVRKITSRKFWVALAGLVAGIALLFGGGKAGAEQWQGVILTLGSIIAYALGEGWADAQRTDYFSNTSYYPVWMDKPEGKDPPDHSEKEVG